jgi:hypothetical protein
MNAERIHAGIALALKQMAERGWHADLCLLRPDETAGPDVERRLKAQTYAAPRVRQGRRGAFYGRLSFRRSSSGLSTPLFFGLARDSGRRRVLDFQPMIGSARAIRRA